VRGIQKDGAERATGCGDLPSEWDNAKIGKAVMPGLIRHLVGALYMTLVVLDSESSSE